MLSQHEYIECGPNFQATVVEQLPVDHTDNFDLLFLRISPLFFFLFFVFFFLFFLLSCCLFF